MEQIDEAQRRVGQPLQHVERVAHVQADIGQPPVADMAERAGDAVEERLDADEAVIGQQIGAIGEMLAGAEADLEMERAIVAEQAAGRRSAPRPARSSAGSSVSTSAACPARSGRPLRAAVEAADGGGIVHVESGERLLSCNA